MRDAAFTEAAGFSTKIRALSCGGAPPDLPGKSGAAGGDEFSAKIPTVLMPVAGSAGIFAENSHSSIFDRVKPKVAEVQHG